MAQEVNLAKLKKEFDLSENYLNIAYSSFLDNEDLDMPEGMFANMFMTFDTVPKLGKISRGNSLHEKIQSLKVWRDKWGGSTNIELALDLLLDIAVKGNITSDKMPKVLAIFSDMQFDQGDKNWNSTSYDMMVNKFKDKNYEVPHILFWNLRSNTVGFQVKADTPNTSMVSGNSTRMMDLFLTSTIEEMQKEFSNISNTPNTKPNTLTMMEKIYTHDMFNNYNDKISKIVDKIISIKYKTPVDSPTNDMFGDMIKQMMGSMDNISQDNMNMSKMFSNMMNINTNTDEEIDIDVTNVRFDKENNTNKNADLDDELDEELDEELDNKQKPDSQNTQQTPEQPPCIIS
jgi:hypothetical protein